MKVDVQRLRALYAAATPGPWDVDDVKNEGDYGDGGPDCKTGFNSSAIYDAMGLVLFDSLNSDVAIVHEEAGEDRLYAWDEVARNNAALVVAAVNALPKLLAIAEAYYTAPVVEIDNSGDEARMIATGSEMDNIITSATVGTWHGQTVRLVRVVGESNG